MNAVDSDGLPVLSLAAVNGHVDCIGPLVGEGGANVNAKARRSVLYQHGIGLAYTHDCIVVRHWSKETPKTSIYGRRHQIIIHFSQYGWEAGW